MKHSHHYWQNLVGKRLLFTLPGRRSLHALLHEDILEEVAPSGEHLKFLKLGWQRVEDFKLVEILDAATDKQVPTHPPILPLHPAQPFPIHPEQPCMFEELAKDPANLGKSFGLVCNCPKCATMCAVQSDASASAVISGDAQEPRTFVN
jgi:hypothetical protein